MKIVIIGGSGMIGTKLVRALRERGHEVVAASPRSGVNSVTGEGLAEAVRGAGAVVDVTNAPAWDDAAVMAFFETSTRNLLRAAADAGVEHFVALSVVGADRMSAMGFMRAKVAQERLIRTGSVPYTVVRATQFFEFVAAIAEAGATDGTVRLPAAQFQPIAGDDVAAALADVVEAPPVNGTVEVGGPERQPFVEFARRLLAATGDPRPVAADESARYFGVAVDDHTLTPAAGARIGATRFGQWLDRAAKEGTLSGPKRAAPAEHTAKA